MDDASPRPGADTVVGQPPLSPPLDRRPRLLKNGDTFAMLDAHGDIGADRVEAAEGLWYRDARHLSRLRLTVSGAAPVLLSSDVSLDNAIFRADLTTPELTGPGPGGIPRDTLHLGRTVVLGRSGWHERLCLRNWGLAPLTVEIALTFGADFADIFEARGFRRDSRETVVVEPGPGAVCLSCLGQDGNRRSTRLRFEPAPDALDTGRASWRLTLPPRSASSLFLAADCGAEAPPRRSRDLGFFGAIRGLRRTIRATDRRSAGVVTSETVANEIFGRARADLTMLTTDTEAGAYPFAGVPWFSAPFGRDGLITAFLTLAFDPEIARGVLTFLAAAQAQADDPHIDAEPGKILHEARLGELSAIGALPFRRYYGTVDATPLFVALTGAYLERTGDLATIRAVAPAVTAALDWVERHGDLDGDGLIEFARRRSDGLLNQGWKDSSDSSFHADGSLAEGPVALVEVQGYAVMAWRAGARIAAALGQPDRATLCTARAEALVRKIDAAYWDEGLGFAAMALDGRKRRCAVRASNAGHLLFAGAASDERAPLLAQTLMSPAFFTGFGLRTLAATEARYNPMSYHNGSVWPHDTALIALGLARYGFKAAAVRLLEALLDAAARLEQRRLPELFCGFRRSAGIGPTLYPLACAPQAWAAAAPFGALAAALGLSVDAGARQVRLDRPRLPRRLEEVRLTKLRIGEAWLDLRCRRAGSDVAVDVLDRVGDLEVAVTL